VGRAKSGKDRDRDSQHGIPPTKNGFDFCLQTVLQFSKFSPMKTSTFIISKVSFCKAGKGSVSGSLPRNRAAAAGLGPVGRRLHWVHHFCSCCGNLKLR
jgi:hypothetical protein